jgi:hypothetical protein
VLLYQGYAFPRSLKADLDPSSWKIKFLIRTLRFKTPHFQKKMLNSLILNYFELRQYNVLLLKRKKSNKCENDHFWGMFHVLFPGLRDQFNTFIRIQQLKWSGSGFGSATPVCTKINAHFLFCDSFVHINNFLLA